MNSCANGRTFFAPSERWSFTKSFCSFNSKYLSRIGKRESLALSKSLFFAKNKLFDKANDSLLPIRERYFELKEQKDLVKDHLSDGAKKVRPLAQEFIEEIRSKIGIS